MERSIVIIGAGLTGLAAGCYGRMNHYKTNIYEMHTSPGGVCTAWKRKGYTIDGSVNWVMGTRPGDSFHRFWEELGAAQSWTVYDHERAAVVEDRAGKALTLYCDADRFERHLLEIAPEDGAAIRELTGAVRRTSRLVMPADKPRELFGPIDVLKSVRTLPMMGFLKKWSAVSVEGFTSRLKSPFLREVLPLAFGPEVSLMMIIMMLGLQHTRSAGYLIGGALALVGSIEKRYLDLGGEVSYGARVEKILVENDAAVGVRLEDGSVHRGDWVVSAADGRTTIFDMLEGRYVDEKIKKRYENPRLFQPLVYVALGVTRKLDELAPSIAGLIYPLDRPVTIAGRERRTLNVRSYSFDPTLAPEGKEVLVVQFDTDYDFWKNLKREPARYDTEKEHILRDVITCLEQRFPGIKADIEMTDVATPITWERYTGNWRGAYEGWVMDAESFTSSMRKTLPGLHRFYMAGQWVNPGGGIPTAVMSGNHTIQMICKEDRRKFVACEP